MPYTLIDEYNTMMRYLNDNLIVNDLWIVRKLNFSN